MIRKFWAVFVARNKEFVRDRSSLGWYILFPILLVGSMAWMFGDSDRAQYKVAVVGDMQLLDGYPFMETRFIQFIPNGDIEDAQRKVARHQVDLLLAAEDSSVLRYFINESSPKGYVLEQILAGRNDGRTLQREVVTDQAVEYIDWLLPGILGMNAMFGCLFGVGYVIVRYRKNGFLKRLHATPLKAFEFITAQLASRLILVMFLTISVFIGADYFLDIRVDGSFVDLFLMTVLGVMSMIALGLLIAARISSEELAGSLLNLVTWPMMMISGVWFSLEGTPQAVQLLAKIFPLTHMLEGLRAIMFDGANLAGAWENVLVLLLMTLAFLSAGAMMFKWKPE